MNDLPPPTGHAVLCAATTRSTATSLAAVSTGRRVRARDHHAPGRESHTKEATMTRSEPGQIFTAGAEDQFYLSRLIRHRGLSGWGL